MTLLDEVMVDVTTGDLTPVFAGLAYCAVIEECQLVFDVQRAHVWTEALNRWSSAQPGLVPYRRQCLAHRAEILLFHSAWSEAAAEAALACEMVSQVPDRLSTGDAWYVRAEVHRLRGDLAKAEEAYREASRLGRTVNPGMARLRLAQDQAQASVLSLRRELEETGEARSRSILLDALVEVLIALGENDDARVAAAQLSALAQDVGTALPEAMALRARGAVALADGDLSAALVSLRRSWRLWYDLESPYEAARVRVLIGLSCRGLGDLDSADLELDAASQIFAQLGARPDMIRLNALHDPSAEVDRHGLTQRELEVLRLLVTGNTNHAIAAQLVVSDHTVRRHVQNIFAKLGVSSRAAATAFALQHDLL
jgi:ATP/maltotriose-dependent transcriptional regulator MalT